MQSCSSTVWRRWWRRVCRAVTTSTFHIHATRELWVPSRPTSTFPPPCQAWVLAVSTLRPTAVSPTSGRWRWPPRRMTTWARWAPCTVAMDRPRTRPSTAEAVSSATRPPDRTNPTPSSERVFRVGQNRNFWLEKCRVNRLMMYVVCYCTWTCRVDETNPLRPLSELLHEFDICRPSKLSAWYSDHKEVYEYCAKSVLCTEDQHRWSLWTLLCYHYVSLSTPLLFHGTDSLLWFFQLPEIPTWTHRHTGLAAVWEIASLHSVDLETVWPVSADILTLESCSCWHSLPLIVLVCGLVLGIVLSLFWRNNFVMLLHHYGLKMIFAWFCQ